MDIARTGTSFATVYDSFLARVTSDMYENWEFTELDTFCMLQELLLNAIHWFEFPRVDLQDYEIGDPIDTEYQGVDSDNEKVPATLLVGGFFNSVLTNEEINILAMYMVVEWLGQQEASTENTRMKYSGADFKFTSQANHMAKIKVLKEQYIQEAFHLQRLYKRRIKTENGEIHSTVNTIMTTPLYGIHT